MRKRPMQRAHRRVNEFLAVSVLCLVSVLARAGEGRIADTPVAPQPSAESQSLLAYLSYIYGKKILSGQQDGLRGTNDVSFELSYIEQNSGKLPAILGLDLSGTTMAQTNAHDVVRRAIAWHKQNGIVTICWHWTAPMGRRAFYTKDTDFDIRQAVIEGTPEHTAAIRDIDRIADELKLLRDAGVPVLWRPLHEMN